MSLYKHVLLATDLSDITELVAHKAKEIAEQFNAKLTILHVIEPIPAYGYPGVTDIEGPYIEEAREELQNIGKKIKVPQQEIRVEFGSVKTQILNVATELGIDLIIIGSHGRHGFSRLLGSNASSIIHGSHCDVITVRCDKQ